MKTENRILWRGTCTVLELALLALPSILGTGCASVNPYEDPNSWLVCENARPQYFALYDVFYLSPTNYTGTGEYPYAVCRQARLETVEQFGVHTRVFAPVYHDAQDVETALEYYLETYHGNGLPWPLNEDERPFVFVGEGLGAKLLAELEQRELKDLKKKGFLGGWYSPDTQKGFMTATTVRDVNDVVRAEIYRRTWGRDGQ